MSFKFRPYTTAASLVGAICFLTSSLFADKIILKSGAVIEGEVFHQTSLLIRVRSGTVVQTINKADIKRIIFEEARKPTEEEKLRAEAREHARLADEARAAREAKLAEEARKRKEAEEKARNAEKPREITHAGAIWRSALIPGWGQYYTGRKRAALGFGAAFGFSAGLKLYTVAGATHARKDYLTSVNQLLIATVIIGGPGRTLSGLEYVRLDERQNAIRRMNRKTNQDVYATGLLALAYAGNIIDVVLYKPGKYSIVSFGVDSSQARFAYSLDF
ncbi:MAG: hypothetical protein K8S54_08420 [Spirochaetia bacterium]|nr:hypothetical protein [Spirochaetia bacterium]